MLKFTWQAAGRDSEESLPVEHCMMPHLNGLIPSIEWCEATECLVRGVPVASMTFEMSSGMSLPVDVAYEEEHLLCTTD